MTPVDSFIQFLLNFNIWLLAKVFVLAALLLYVVFAFMVLKEVNLMTKTLTGVFNLPIRIISFIHLLFSLLVFTLAVIIL